MVREAEKINVPEPPTPPTFMRWLRQVADECASASPHSDEAQRWVMSILTITFEQAGVVPRKFKRLDMKLKAALKRVIKHGLLATNIDTRTSQLEDLDQLFPFLTLYVQILIALEKQHEFAIVTMGLEDG